MRRIRALERTRVDKPPKSPDTTVRDLEMLERVADLAVEEVDLIAPGANDVATIAVGALVALQAFLRAFKRLMEAQERDASKAPR